VLKDEEALKLSERSCFFIGVMNAVERLIILIAWRDMVDRLNYGKDLVLASK
jgi:hypothetical protein